MTPNIYEQTAKYYDLGSGNGYGREDIDFYLNLFDAPKNILEAGGGTGRVSIELARHNHNVTAFDLSKPMLDIFKEKIKAEFQNRLKIFHADMTSFSFGSLFDGIIFPLWVFQALQNNTDRKKTLACVRAHMHENSIAVVTMFNPNPQITNNWGKKGILDFDISLEDGTRLRRITNQLFHDSSNQIITTESIYQNYSDEHTLSETCDRMQLGYLYPEEAELLFESSGFKILHLYSDYQKNKIKPDEYRNLIFLLQKK